MSRASAGRIAPSARVDESLFDRLHLHTTTPGQASCLCVNHMVGKRSRRRTVRPVRQRMISTLATVSYLLAVVGYPVPAATPRKDSDRPFPCQDRVCGCQTAEQCWQSCCCFSPEQRQAWQRDNQPSVSSSDRAHGGSWQGKRLRDQDEPKEKSCCESADSSDTSSCSSGDADEEQVSSCCQTDEPAGSESGKGNRWVLGIAAAKCQGTSTLWLLTGSVLPASVVTWRHFSVPEDRIELASEISMIHSFKPPTPPPRG